MSGPETLHASCVVFGEHGILIRGASGSGKSQLARELLTEAERSGRFARLVADDRVQVEARHGRLIARAVPSTAGLLEVRGLGLIMVDHEPSAVLRLVVDCLDDQPLRFPDEHDVVIDGVRLPWSACQTAANVASTLLWRITRCVRDHKGVRDDKMTTR